MANGLVRDAAGRYHSADERFTVEHEGTHWYVRDTRQTDELGLPRVLGPYQTLDAVREAIASVPAPQPKNTRARRKATK
jgi:hypothetical protein